MIFVDNGVTWTCNGYSTVKYLNDNFGFSLARAAEFVPNAILYPCFYKENSKVHVRCSLKRSDGMLFHFGLLTDDDKHYVFYSKTFTLKECNIASLYEHKFLNDKVEK